jgi:O-antigen ligase
MEWMMVAFSVITTLSWFTGGADWGTGKLRWFTTLVTLCYQPFVAFSIARRVPFDRPTITKLVWGIAIIGIYLGFTGIFEHFGRSQFIFPKYIIDCSVGVQCGRARGPFAASVVNGGALIISFLCATFVWSGRTGLKKALTLFGVMTPIAVTVYFTDTRGVWVGFGGVLAVLAVTKSRMSKLGLYIVLFGAIVYVSGVFSKFSMWEISLFSRRTTTVDYRWANYATTYKMFQSSPLFGIGYGNFTKYWRLYFVTDSDGETRDLADGNNTTFLAILGEEGLVGFSAYFSIFVLGGIGLWKAYWRLRGDQWEFERRFVIVTAGILSAFLLQGITTDVRFHSFFNVALFIFFGISSSLAPGAQAGGSLQPGNMHKSRVALGPLANTRS